MNNVGSATGPSPDLVPPKANTVVKMETCLFELSLPNLKKKKKKEKHTSHHPISSV